MESRKVVGSSIAMSSSTILNYCSCNSGIGSVGVWARFVCFFWFGVRGRCFELESGLNIPFCFHFLSEWCLRKTAIDFKLQIS